MRLLFFPKKEMRKNNLKINVIFNAAYQILILFVSLVTTPYISTVFTSDIVGSYSYAYSVSQYFSLAADFGFTMYGTAMIAQVRGKKEKETRLFWGIIYSKAILDAALILLYFILAFSGCFYNDNYPLNDFKIYLCLILPTIGYLVDTTFLFQGKEKFVSLCARNLILKVVCTILIFVLVKSPSDYLIYVLIMGLSYFLTGFVSMIGTPFLIGKPQKISTKELGLHFKKSFAFFIPNIATCIYTIASKTLLGAIGGNSIQSGYFEQADKLVGVVVTIINSLSTIIMSRMAYLYANKKYDEIKQKTNRVLQIYCLLSLPCFLGLLVVNDYLTLGFLGNNFEGSIDLVYILSLKILFTPAYGIIGSIYYIPNNDLRKRNVFLIIAAIFNLIANSIMVHFLSAIGAAIASVLTEGLIFGLFWAGSRKKIDLQTLPREWIICLDASLLMFITLVFSKEIILAFISTCLVSMGIMSDRIIFFVSAAVISFLGLCIYCFFLLLFKEKFAVDILKTIREKLKCFKKEKDQQ